MKNFMVTAFLAMAMLLAPSLSNACTCDEIYGDGSPRSMMHRAKAVFVGEVLSVTSTSQSDLADGVTPHSARFRVERYWKGVKAREITVHTDLYGCGPNLQVGRKYLVYASGKGLETACSRTRELGLANQDLRDIGPGKEFKREKVRQ
jgi:hypothetical protein